MEFPVWEVPEYYGENECLWKQKGKEGHSKWLGYVGRNERVINVCRTQMRNFKLNLEQEKSSWKPEVKGYMVSVLGGSITITAVFCVVWKGCWMLVMLQKFGL